MATIGKKKFKEITQISMIHEAIISLKSKEESSFLESNPEMWDSQEKELYDLLIAHESLILNKVTEILKK